LRSLRSRLILGFAVVALVPLASALFLLSRRVEGTVREQAAERLDAALGRLAVGLTANGERIAEKLRILAQDPLLKRLYLLRPAGSRDLTEYLAEKRFLLDLDFLHVADTSGAPVADAAVAASALARAEKSPVAVGRLSAAGAHGPLIEELPDAHALVLSASAPIRYEGATTGWVRGGLALDADFLARLARASGVELVLTDARGRAVAATLGGGEAPELPAGSGARRVALAGRSYWSQSFPLAPGPSPGAHIVGLVPTAAADRTVAALELAAALLAVLGLLVAVALGALWSSQVTRPVERLAAFSQRIARGEWDEPLRLETVRELQSLVEALERMREDLGSYRDRLVTSERLAAWGQMARAVAHEIKNPLTPIAVAVADLKRSFEQKRPDFPQILEQAVRTIAAEVDALKRILQEFSEFARLPAPRFEAFRLGQALADLEALYAGEVAARRLEFAPPEGDVDLVADAGQLKQALVNLIQNGLEALDGGGRVRVSAAVEGGALEIAVSDTGAGLSPERRARLFVPDLTTKAHGTGLGLVIVQRIVHDHRGTIAVESAPGRGTTFRIRLPLVREG
jgi:signal transduction histidine kinase